MQFYNGYLLISIEMNKAVFYELFFNFLCFYINYSALISYYMYLYFISFFHN